MKNLIEHAGRASIPRFWCALSSVFTGKEITMYISSEWYISESIDGHVHGTYRDAICKYDNTRARVYTIQRPM